MYSPAPRGEVWWLAPALGLAGVLYFVVSRAPITTAVLAGPMLAAIVVVTRQLLPREPVAGAVGAVALALTPPVRDAVLAADVPAIVLAIAGIAAMGAFRLPRRSAMAIGIASAIAIGIVATGWLGAGPPIAPGLAAVIASSGRGAAAVVVAVGLLGAGFGALTGLRGAAPLVIAIAVLAAIGWVVPMLAILAIGAAIPPAAMTRAAGANLTAVRRHLLTVAAGLPIIAAAIAVGS